MVIIEICSLRPLINYLQNVLHVGRILFHHVWEILHSYFRKIFNGIYPYFIDPIFVAFGWLTCDRWQFIRLLWINYDVFSVIWECTRQSCRYVCRFALHQLDLKLAFNIFESFFLILFLFKFTPSHYFFDFFLFFNFANFFNWVFDFDNITGAGDISTGLPKLTWMIRIMYASI